MADQQNGLEISVQLIRLSAICFAVALSLTGCAAEDEVDAASAAKSPNTNVQEVQDPAEQPSDPATCLEGTWLVDNEYFLAQFKDIGGSELTEVTGKVTQAFDATGVVVTVYDDWRIDSVAEGVETSIIRSGTDRGTFIADGLTLSLHETEIGSKLVVSAAGMEQVHAANALSFSEVSYACDATTASIAAPDGTANLARID